MKWIKNTFKNTDKTLLFVTIFMLGFGLINIVTASSREAVVVNEEGIYYYFYRQIAILAIGVIASIFVTCLPTVKYYKISKLMYFGVLGLIGYCFFMSAKRGAQNWIVLAGFQFQPSELAKPILIICLALIFEKYYKNFRNKDTKHHNDVIGFTFVVALLIPGLIFLQKDLGTALIILSIVGILFLGSPILLEEKKKVVISAIVAIIVVCGGMLLTKGYILTDAQLARFDFWRPCSKYENGGYQTCNAQIAINDGGLLGLGIGKSKQKYSYIPEPHTDSIFAIIGEEWGVLLCTAFVFLPYAFILYRIFDIASKASTIRGKYICLGVGTYIFAHIFINLGGLFGLIPLTGVPLPFLSYGGTYTLCLMVSLSLVQRVYIETKTRKIKVT